MASFGAMQCPGCSAEMRTQTVSRYHYVECGLDDVWATDVEVSTCACGNRVLDIPNRGWIHDEAAAKLRAKREALSEKERAFMDDYQRNWANRPETLYIAQEIPFTPPARRKDPCPCGSGDEYRKCHEKKRPRTQRVVWGIHTKGPMPIEAWAEKLAKPDFGYLETGYIRETPQRAQNSSLEFLWCRGQSNHRCNLPMALRLPSRRQPSRATTSRRTSRSSSSTPTLRRLA